MKLTFSYFRLYVEGLTFVLNFGGNIERKKLSSEKRIKNVATIAKENRILI